MERTAPVTGNGASRPLRRGPRVCASAVKAITTAVAVTIRKGMSHAGARRATATTRYAHHPAAAQAGQRALGGKGGAVLEREQEHHGRGRERKTDQHAGHGRPPAPAGEGHRGHQGWHEQQLEPEHVPHPLAPAYRLSAARHSARASANASPATSAAASAISGRSRPVSADAGMVVVHAIGIRYTNRNRSAPGYAETG